MTTAKAAALAEIEQQQRAHARRRPRTEDGAEAWGAWITKAGELSAARDRLLERPREIVDQDPLF